MDNKNEAAQAEAFDVTLNETEAKALRDMLGDEGDDAIAVRMLVGPGHSGYGLYVAQAEYQDEGAILVHGMPAPAANQPRHTGMHPAMAAPYGEAPELNPADLRIDTFRPGGSGGFVVRPDTAVRITHLPTGLFVEESEDRSIHRNKAVAVTKLRNLVANQQRQLAPMLRSDPQPEDFGVGPLSVEAAKNYGAWLLADAGRQEGLKIRHAQADEIVELKRTVDEQRDIIAMRDAALAQLTTQPQVDLSSLKPAHFYVWENGKNVRREFYPAYAVRALLGMDGGDQ